MEPIVIIGGGIAGLSCLNKMLDKSVSPLLLEACTIGTPKMCGEFIAPPAVILLQQWEINLSRPIQKINFFTKNAQFTLTLPQPAGALARSKAEDLLAKRAQQKGARIRENSTIQKIIPSTDKSPHIICLATGEEIQARTIIFATGKYQATTGYSAKPIYYGMKIHFEHTATVDSLLMYSFPGAYLGIIPISNTVCNCACLARREVVEKMGSSKEFFYNLINSKKSLQDIFGDFDIMNTVWLEGATPEFGNKLIPNWRNTYWIGDAIASLPPAIGLGFTFSMLTGVMAADYYLQNNPTGYRQAAMQLVKSKMMIGKFMHYLLLNPILATFTVPLLKANPWAIAFLLKRIGYT